MKQLKKVKKILLDVVNFLLSPLYYISKMFSGEKMYKFLISKKYIIYIISLTLSLLIFLLLYFLY